MNPYLLALYIFGAIALIGFALSGILIYLDLRKQHRARSAPRVNDYWSEIYKACNRAERNMEYERYR